MRRTLRSDLRARTGTQGADRGSPAAAQLGEAHACRPGSLDRPPAGRGRGGGGAGGAGGGDGSSAAANPGGAPLGISHRGGKGKKGRSKGSDAADPPGEDVRKGHVDWLYVGAFVEVRY